MFQKSFISGFLVNAMTTYSRKKDKHTPESMMPGITKTKHPHSTPEEVILNHHCVKAGKHFLWSFQLLVVVFYQDRCPLFLSDLQLEFCPLVIGFVSRPKLQLHLDAKLAKLGIDEKGKKGVSP